MRKKIGILIAVGAAVALLQWAVPSADSAVSQVQQETVQASPADQSCPMDKSCPTTKSCPDGAAKTGSCPVSGEKI